jgi:hypothetical protein
MHRSRDRVRHRSSYKSDKLFKKYKFNVAKEDDGAAAPADTAPAPADAPTDGAPADAPADKPADKPAKGKAD